MKDMPYSFIVSLSQKHHFIPFQCNNGGCLVELAQQLAVIMIGKQIINNAQEIIVP